MPNHKSEKLKSKLNGKYWYNSYWCEASPNDYNVDDSIICAGNLTDPVGICQGMDNLNTGRFSSPDHTNPMLICTKFLKNKV